MASLMDHLQKSTRGHELYLRYLLLIGEVVPKLLRAIVEKAVKHRKGCLQEILIEAKLTIRMLFMKQYIQLFSDGVVNTDLQSWDTRLLCIVIGLLFTQDLPETEFLAVTCIMEHINDLDKYTSSASLDYKTYQSKWKVLHEALIELLKTTKSEAKYDCTRLIQSFANEPIKVNMDLIERMKEHEDITEHLMVAIQYGVSDIFNTGCIEKETTVEISRGLHDVTVKESGTLTLRCEFTKPCTPVKWLRNNREIIPGTRYKIISANCTHMLVLENISQGDSAVYTCSTALVKSECFVEVEGSPASFTACLQDADVYEDESIYLTCEVDTYATAVHWFKFSEQLAQTNRISLKRDGQKHCLEITAACLEDTGIYTCLSGDKLTSAFVNVKAMPVTIIEPLTDTYVYEAEDITLACKVNKLKKTPVCFHNGKNLDTSSVRRSFAVNGKELKLTILNAKLYDDGSYEMAFGDITTKAILTVMGKMDKLVFFPSPKNS